MFLGEVMFLLASVAWVKGEFWIGQNFFIPDCDEDLLKLKE